MGESEPQITRRLLVLSNLYHSTPRIPGLCKYLPLHGWEPTVITPKIDEKGKTHVGLPMRDIARLRIIPVGEETTYEQRKKTSRMHRMVQVLDDAADKINPSPDSDIKTLIERNYWRAYTIRNFPDPERGWEGPLLEAARKLLKEERFDAILSSSSPVITHIAASKLHDETQLPWVADLRDLWSQNHNLPMGKALRAKTAKFEKRTLAGASAIVTVSPLWVDELKRLHPESRVCSITNGFDPEDAVEVRARPDKFTITYTGQIYAGKQDPTLAIKSIKKILDESTVRRDELELRFYGPTSETVSDATMKLGLDGVVIQHRPVPRGESLLRQWESHLLLLLDWDDESQPGVIPLKFFEYVHTGNPILATGGTPDGIVSKMINEVGCGRTARTVDDAVAAIQGYLTVYRKGGVLCAPHPERTARFSYPYLAKSYAEVLNLAVGFAGG